MTEINLDEYYEAVVMDSNGDKVGGVGQVFLDEETGKPSWVTVRTGLFGLKESFVPLVEHRLDDGRLHVPFTKDFIKDAPRQDPEAPMTVAEEDALQAYYNTEDEPEKLASAQREQEVAAGAGQAPADIAEAEESDRADADATEPPAVPHTEHKEPETEVYPHQTDFAEKAEADLLEDTDVEDDRPLPDDDRSVEVDREH